MLPHYALRLAFLISLAAPWGCLAVSEDSPSTDPLAQGFVHPPDSAKPWVYWWWLDSNVSREGITRDLEEMKRQGIGGAMIFDAGEGHDSPTGPPFMSPAWRDLFQFAVTEAARLDLQFSFNICSGWNCGGTWVTPDYAMKKITWSQTRIQGPLSFSQELPQPPVTDDYYRDVAVLAFRVLEDARPTNNPPTPEVLDLHSRVNLTQQMEPSGRLVWDVPSGPWLILRFGQTLQGGGQGRTKCASRGTQGFEIDFFNTDALDRHLAETADKVVADVNSFAGKTLMYLHDDSWECGEPNWTPRMLDEFQQRRGYNLLPYLPALAGKILDNLEVTTRFQRDFRRTQADLMAENHYGHFQERARKWGMGIHPEAGGPFFVSTMDALMNLGRCDIPMGEYWIRKSEPNGGIWFVEQYPVCDSVRQAAAAAHIYGKKLCQAEAFTNMGRNWEEAPSMMKAIGDRAFCAGLTRNMLCFYVHQPNLTIKPGYQWPEAGTHFDRNITWWNQIHAFTTYQSRCQFLLQQGRFAADVCYYAGEDAPCFVPAKNAMNPPLPAGYDCDTINAEVLLTRMACRDGRLVLPDGLNYRVLVLPQREAMSPAVLRKIAALVEAGALVAGPKPTRSPGLENYPNCDEEVRTLADQVWGNCDGRNVKEHPYGKGKIVWGKSLVEILSNEKIRPDFTFASPRGEANLDFIHRHCDGCEIYLVSNQNDRVEEVQCAFRVSGRLPELWDAVTGAMREAAAFTQTEEGLTLLPLQLAPQGSVFVIFRKTIPGNQQGNASTNDPTLTPVLTISGPWTVTFDPQWGGPESVEFTDLVSWTQRPEEGIKYYSGTAAYHRSFSIPESTIKAGERLFLDLGEFKYLAEVRLNGKELGVIWTKPFRVEVTEAIQPGENRLEIDIVNLWPNRLIGDQWLPEEKRFTKTNVKKYKKDSPLLESGLFGPVQLCEAR